MATILVTRPEQDAERTAARLRADGHEVILSPVLTVRLIDAPPPTGPVDALVVASANAAAWLARAEVRRILAAKTAFAVGDHAAESIRSAGYGDVRSAAGAAGDLVELASHVMTPPAHLLAPVGQVHGDEIIVGLRARGFHVEPLVVYDAAPVAQLSPEAIAGLRYDVINAVLHYSTRSAARFIELAEQAGARDRLARPRHVCLSREILESLPDDLREHAVAADAPNEDALFAALAQALGQGATVEIVSPDDTPARAKRSSRARTPRMIDGEAKRVADVDNADFIAPAAPEASSPDHEIAAPQPSLTISDIDPSTAKAQDDAQGPRESPVSETASDRAQASEPARGATPQASSSLSSSSASPNARHSDARPRSVIMTPLLVGGFAGAAAGAGIAFWALSVLSPPRQPPLDMGALDARLALLTPRADLAAAQQRIDGVATGLERERVALRNEIAALAKRIDGLPAPSAATPEGAVDPDLKNAIAAQAQTLQALTQRMQSLDMKLDEAVRASSPRASAPAPDAANVIRRHALASAVAQSLARGDAYVNELAALASLGATPDQVAALQVFASGGAPTARALGDAFKPVAAALARQAAAESSGSITDRAAAALKQLVRIRPVGEASGDDVASLVARIEAALARGSFADALAAYTKLPESQRGVAAEWGGQLKRRADAAIAAQAMLDEAARALAAPAK